jgi:hypothetical protein
MIPIAHPLHHPPRHFFSSLLGKPAEKYEWRVGLTDKPGERGILKLELQNVEKGKVITTYIYSGTLEFQGSQKYATLRLNVVGPGGRIVYGYVDAKATW